MVAALRRPRDPAPPTPDEFKAARRMARTFFHNRAGSIHPVTMEEAMDLAVHQHRIATYWRQKKGPTSIMSACVDPKTKLPYLKIVKFNDKDQTVTLACGHKRDWYVAKDDTLMMCLEKPGKGKASAKGKAKGVVKATTDKAVAAKISKKVKAALAAKKNGKNGVPVVNVDKAKKKAAKAKVKAKAKGSKRQAMADPDDNSETYGSDA